MTATRPAASTTATSRRAARAAAVSLAVWGGVHVVGGVSLVSMTATEGLDTLGPDAPTPAPETAGEAAAALLHFHGLNVAAAGLAVLLLAVAWARTRRAWQAAVALGLAVVLDIGLLWFLVAPGLLPADQGLIGPALLTLAVASLAVAFTNRSPDAARGVDTPATIRRPS